MPLAVVCEESNDLYRTLLENRVPCSRVSAPADADDDSGVLVLADGYPGTPVEFPESLFLDAATRGQKLFVEFPASIPMMYTGEMRDAHWERVVVSSGVFGEALPSGRILMAHSCRFLEVHVPEETPETASEPVVTHLELARVAGFDTAVYGLPPDAYPLLFEHTYGGVLIAATRLSGFRTGRYAPSEAWDQVWRFILHEVAPDLELSSLEWTAPVRPSYGPCDTLGAPAQREAIHRGASWYRNARLFIHPGWKDEAQRRLNEFEDGTGPGPEPHWPCGDGSLGMIEGASSRIMPDGSQHWRYFLRNDCMGEASMALALAERVAGTRGGAKISANLNDFIYFTSNLAKEGREYPTNPSYGLVNWDTRAPRGGTFYGDDNARSMLGTMAAAAVLETDRWDEPLLKCLLANLRTTGIHGFRGGSLSGNQLSERGWRTMWERELTNFHPHYEAYLWACFLWAYARTDYRPFYDSARSAIALTMDAYPDEWKWTNGIQQERARMLLPLAWLVRVEDTDEHRAWLRHVGQELLAHQDSSGAIREEVGSVGKGNYGPPTSNESYGTNEAPLIQENGDPLCDLLYTTNFAFIGLHEAAAATGWELLAEAGERLAQFLCRIQVRSEEHLELDGAWFRAFEFHRWDYWASNADLGWGTWSVESGWTQGWITATLALRELGTTHWDLTAGSSIDRHISRLADQMLPSEQA